ncbi:MAG: alpha-glucan family phosphorylase [Gammaproteobacteria bacterium]|nr:alpha-glucan family phosphorylase [Gammaproteobacteria bacterium]
MSGTRFRLEVQPVIPEQIGRLRELANNLMYCWDSQIRSLFIRLDPELWRECGHNPKVFLRRVSQQKLEDAIRDAVYLQDYQKVMSAYDAYNTILLNEATKNHKLPLDLEHDTIAYFCAEFGLHESFPIYSGGLGILAGDHCKAASDLGLPFVGVGMLYRQGYFNQTIDGNGNQIAHYFETNPADLPIEAARDASGHDIHVHIEMPRRSVELKVWRARAGHITLYLLDSDLPGNSDEDRRITHQLYGGDRTTRIQQEIVLGIGGVRALRAVGVKPTVWHINEGHAAFMIMERSRELIEQGYDFDSALQLTAASTVFTTHTPVPAGHDIFDHALILPYFREYLKRANIEEQRFLELGSYPGNPHSFNMTSLALRGSCYHNGVSRIHGQVASQMEGYIWPQIPADENPIGHVTNGVHVPTFLAREWVNMFDMFFKSGWRNELLNEQYWQAIDKIPDHSFWSIRQSLKTKLYHNLNQRLLHQYRRNGLSPTQIERLTQHLASPEKDILTIGFARRFATYKRATLLFSDPTRLARLVNNPDRPVMFIFAGKAHPLDAPGQQLLRTIHEFSLKPEFEGKIIMVEGYDMALARKLVTGVDVWLNTPRYPLEASGTSGEKAGINGVLNLSVLDGWWGEGYNGHNGWAIAPHAQGFDEAFSDREEGRELLDLLENEVIPLYYQWGNHGYSKDWIHSAKSSMKSILPRFNSQRMVMDYVKQYYSPAIRHARTLQEQNGAPGRELAQWKSRVRRAWPNIRMRRTDKSHDEITAGSTMTIEVTMHLDGLSPEDIVVECLLGRVSADMALSCDEIYTLAPAGHNAGNETVFRLELNSPLPGLQYYQVRAYPYHKLLARRFETGLMQWL